MTEGFTYIQDAADVKGKRVLLRASLNAPIGPDGEVLDSFRLDKALKTIQWLKNHDAKVIVIGHLGRAATETLAPVHRYLERVIDLTFVPDILGPEVKNALSNMQSGDVVLLENIRKEVGEKENDEEFAKELAGLADIYVNDAFSVSHREHASIVGVPKHIPSFAGFLFQSEYENLLHARNPEHPALFILGGAKFETKQPLVEKFLTIYDHVFVTGALANDFFQNEGFEVGTSLVSNPPVDVKHLLDHPKIVLPVDVTVLTEDGHKTVRKLKNVKKTDMINDLGPETLSVLEPIIKHAQYILWNGPTGDYQKGFVDGTKGIISLIQKGNAETIVGGGDTMSLISMSGVTDSFSFCSTAGGSMLEFLLTGTIPGVDALKNSPQYE